MLKNKAISRSQFIVWLAAHQKLSTTDKLSKWGLTISTVCVFCSEQENYEQLFLKCSFTRCIRAAVTKNFEYDMIVDDWS